MLRGTAVSPRFPSRRYHDATTVPAAATLLDGGGVAKFDNSIVGHVHTVSSGAVAGREGNETDLQPVKSPTPALGRMNGQRKAPSAPPCSMRSHSSVMQLPRQRGTGF